jgi:membrane protein implicated in regulation of membrane protease activity
MDNVFLICAIVGGTLIVCQFLLTLFGMGGGHDADHGGGHDVGHHGVDHAHGHGDHGSSWFFGMLTLRTVSAFAAFFGLTGMAARQAGLNDLQTLALAIGAGVAAFLIVAWVMRLLHKLNVDGTVRIERAVGCRGSVYLSIPAAKAGLGKVHVNVLSRTMEYQALTSQQDLPIGMPIIVVGVVGPDTVEVAAATESEKNVHV